MQAQYRFIGLCVNVLSNLIENIDFDRVLTLTAYYTASIYLAVGCLSAHLSVPSIGSDMQLVHCVPAGYQWCSASPTNWPS